MTFPVPRDDNGHPLLNCGTESVTYRFASVPVSGNALFMPIDVKSVIIHIEGSTVAAHFSGTATGSTTAYLTSDGISLSDFPIVKATSGTIITCLAPTGTINVSLFGVR